MWNVIVKTDGSFAALIMMMMMGIILHISTQNWNQEYARVQLVYTLDTEQPLNKSKVNVDI